MIDEYFEIPPEDNVVDDIKPITNILKPSDVLHFYEYYISPRSIHRRKLAVYITSLSLAYKSEISQASAITLKDLLAVNTRKELLSINDANQVKGKRNSFGKIDSKTKTLTDQTHIVDTLIKKALKALEDRSANKKLDLPKIKQL